MNSPGMHIRLLASRWSRSEDSIAIGKNISIWQYLGLWDPSPYPRPTPETYALGIALAKVTERDAPERFLHRCYQAFDVHVDSIRNPLNDCAWLASTQERGKVFEFEAGDTVALSLDRFEKELASTRNSQHCLDICAINVSSATEQGLSLYQQKQQLEFIFRGEVDKAAESILMFLTRFICEYWHMEQISLLLDGASPKAWSIWKPLLPSKAATEKTLQDDLSSFDLTWKWLREAPVYDGDAAVYVWQPFNDLPDLDVLRLVVSRGQGHETLQVLMLTSSKVVLDGIRSVYNASDIPAAPGVENQLYCILAAICGKVCSDVARFIADADKQALGVALCARRSASGSKIQYLCHLQECLKLVADHVAKNISVVRKIQTALHDKVKLPLQESQQKLYNATQTLHDCEIDFSYLVGELQKQSEAILISKKMVHEQLDVSERRRNCLVAFFVAIYVPLSFTATFLGMNIAGNFGGMTTAKAYRGEILDTSSKLTGSTLSSSYSWPMWMFYALAIPLTFGTIILPVIAGPTYRFFAQFCYRNRLWWRVIVATMAIIIGIGLGITQMFCTPMIYVLIPLITIWAGSHMLIAIRLRYMAMGFFWFLLLVSFTVVTGFVPLEQSKAHVILWSAGVIAVTVVCIARPEWFYVSFKSYLRERQKKRNSQERAESA